MLHLCIHPEVQFRPYRTDDFITRLYYETPRFTVLNQTWVLKARVNDSERNPNLSCKRTLSFQLILKSKVHLLPTYFIFRFLHACWISLFAWCGLNGEVWRHLRSWNWLYRQIINSVTVTLTWLLPFVQETNFKQFWKEEKTSLRGYLVYHGRTKYSQGTSVWTQMLPCALHITETRQPFWATQKIQMVSERWELFCNFIAKITEPRKERYGFRQIGCTHNDLII